MTQLKTKELLNIAITVHVQGTMSQNLYIYLSSYFRKCTKKNRIDVMGKMAKRFLSYDENWDLLKKKSETPFPSSECYQHLLKLSCVFIQGYSRGGGGGSHLKIKS